MTRPPETNFLFRSLLPPPTEGEIILKQGAKLHFCFPTKAVGKEQNLCIFLKNFSLHASFKFLISSLFLHSPRAKKEDKPFSTKQRKGTKMNCLTKKSGKGPFLYGIPSLVVSQTEKTNKHYDAVPISSLCLRRNCCFAGHQVINNTLSLFSTSGHLGSLSSLCTV